MRLKVLLPTRVLVDEPVNRVVAEGGEGSFGLLPGHLDLVSALPPGVLLFENREGTESFLAVDEGILVKQGESIRVAVRQAVRGETLAELHGIVRERFLQQDDRQRAARSAMARLEAGFIRRFLEVQDRG